MAPVSNELNDLDLHRRSVFGLATEAVAGAELASVPQTVSAAVRPSDIVMMDGVTLASTIRARQASCVEVMTAYFDHIEKINPNSPIWSVVAEIDEPRLVGMECESIPCRPVWAARDGTAWQRDRTVARAALPLGRVRTPTHPPSRPLM